MPLHGPLFSDPQGRKPWRAFAADSGQDDRLVEVELQIRNGRVLPVAVAPPPEVPVDAPRPADRIPPKTLVPLGSDFGPPDVA